MLLPLILASAFACPSPSIHDGDNIRCAGGRQMRLARIDAPEFASSPRCRRRPLSRGTVCDDRAARAARDNLRRLVAAAPVRCTVVDASPTWSGFQATDRYGRRVVRCTAGGRDLGAEQLRGGYAAKWPPR